MLADPHLTVPHYVPDSRRTLSRHEHQAAESPSPIATRTATASRSAPSRITPSSTRSSTRSLESDIVSMETLGHHEFTLLPLHREALRRPPRGSRAPTAGNAALVNTNAFEQFSFLYSASGPTTASEYVRVLGLDRNKRTSPLDSQRVRHRTGELRQVQGCGPCVRTGHLDAGADAA